jgi:ATP-dependent DNA ligase
MSIEQDYFEHLSNDPQWVAEPKYNGNHCLIHLLNGDVQFWDRHEKRLDFDSNPLYKEGRERIKNIIVKVYGDEDYFQFDSELRHNKVTGIQNKIVLWDNFIFGNLFLHTRPYWSRHANLDILNNLTSEEKEIVKPIEQFKDNFKYHYDRLIEESEEFEGLVLKKLSGKLNLGRKAGINSMWMFKVRKPSGRYRF